MSYMMTGAGIDEIDERIGEALSAHGLGRVAPHLGAMLRGTVNRRLTEVGVEVGADDPVASLQEI